MNKKIFKIIFSSFLITILMYCASTFGILGWFLIWNWIISLVLTIYESNKEVVK